MRLFFLVFNIFFIITLFENDLHASFFSGGLLTPKLFQQSSTEKSSNLSSFNFFQKAKLDIIAFYQYKLYSISKKFSTPEENAIYRTDRATTFYTYVLTTSGNREKTLPSNSNFSRICSLLIRINPNVKKPIVGPRKTTYYTIN